MKQKGYKRLSLLIMAFLVILALTVGAVISVVASPGKVEWDFTAPNTTELINDAIFQGYNPMDPAGSGVFESFLRIGSNNACEKGYNTDGTIEFDTKGGAHTHSFLLSGVPIVPKTPPGGDVGLYREFQLDINQNSGDPDHLLSLDELEVYLTDDPNLTGYPFTGTADKIWELDDGDNNLLKLNYDLAAGSGKRDLIVWIPNDLFTPAPNCGYLEPGCATYVVLYAEFGCDATYINNDGYEEWGVALYEPATMSGVKFEDLDGDGQPREAGEPGLEGWTIYVDYDDNASLDVGEPFDVTDSNGVYTIDGIVPGTYNMREVLQAGWLQSYPSAGYHTETFDWGMSVTDNDFGNYKRGCLEVEKQVDLSDVVGPITNIPDVDFTVTVTGPSYPTGTDLIFHLVDGVISGPQHFSNLIPGNYYVDETPPIGWNLVSILPYPTSVGPGAVCGEVVVTVINKHELGPYIFNGHVYQGYPPDDSTPVAGVTVGLWGDEDEWPEAGFERVLLDSITTNLFGVFSLSWAPIDSQYPYFHIIELDQPGVYSTGAQAEPPGYVKNFNVVSYLDIPPGNYGGIAFWDQPTPPPGGGWCCYDGKVFPSSAAGCSNVGGSFFLSKKDAEDYCGLACTEMLTVDFLGKVTQTPMRPNGCLCDDLNAPSPDGMHLLEIQEGTIILDKEGEVVKLIEITETTTPPLPANTVIVGNTYDFSPSGITFNKSVRLTLGYNVTELPQETLALTMAYYSSEDGWTELETESSQVAELGSLTATTDHFTAFAILAAVTPPPIQSLRVMVWPWSPEVDEAIYRALGEFEELHGVKIDLIRVGGPQVYWEPLLEYLNSDEPPDVLWMHYDMVASLVDLGHIIKLDSFCEGQPEVILRIPHELLERFQYEGELYGIPLGAEEGFALNAYAISTNITMNETPTVSVKADLAFELIMFLRTRTPPPSEKTFTGSVPLISELSTDPKVIGTNALLASFMVIVFYIGAKLFNSTLKENDEIIRGWFRRISSRLLPLRKKTETQSKTKSWYRSYLIALFIVALTALIASFIDPYFGLNWRGVTIFLGIAAAVTMLTYSYEGTQAIVSQRRFHIPATVKIYPWAILLAIAFVIFSRAVDFHPGFLYGFVGSYAILSLKNKHGSDNRQRAICILLGVIIVIIVAVSALLLRELVPRLTLGDAILVATFVVCLEGVIFRLVPITYMDGAKLMNWKKWVWLILFAVVSFMFYTVIVNNQGILTQSVENMKVITIFGIMALFLSLSGLTWLYFYLRQKRGVTHRPELPEA